MLNVGTPLINQAGTLGYIAAIEEETADLWTIGAAGMVKNTAKITAVFPDHISRDLSEHILDSWIRAAEHKEPKTPEAVAAMVAEAEAKQNTARDTERAKRAEAEATSKAWKADNAHRVPAWAKAVILGERIQDKSDIMTDYHHSRTIQTIVLGFSKHTRDLFPEMRKAALNAPETAHLGPDCGHFEPRVLIATDFLSNGSYYHAGQSSPWHSDELPERKHYTTEAEAQAWIDNRPELTPMMEGEKEVYFKWKIQSEEIEHREKYSMGAGFYLKDGYRHSNGWQVSKARTWGNNSLIDVIPAGSVWAIAPRATTPTATASGSGFTIEEHQHTKRLCPVWLCVMADRVEREQFLELRDASKALGGWYSRKWGSTPAGFMFLDLDSAERFAVGEQEPKS